MTNEGSSGSVVVIGAGQAGLSCVARLRKLGFQGAITMIGDEQVPPYQRPPLSKSYLLGEMSLDRLLLRPQRFYDDNAIGLLSGQLAERIDRANKKVIVNGSTIAYSHLVIATGAAPRRLPAAIGGALEGVYAVRDLKDADSMAPQFREGAKVLVIGGGYIGLEAAAVAASKGLKVTLIEKAERILQRVAAPQTSDYFRNLHQSHGVDIREGVGLARLTGDGRVCGAVLDDGSEMRLDFAIVGVGVAPRTELAEAAGLDIDNGIKADALGRSSDPAIWTAGDCASFPHGGVRVRLESVPNAIDMGTCVADNITGAQKAYVAKPWFWSDQYDVKLQIAGIGTGHDRVITRKGGKEGSMSFWYFAGDKLLAVDAANDPRAYMAGKKWIEQGQSVDPDQVADSSRDLKGLTLT